MLKYIKLITINYSIITSNITIHNKPPQLLVLSCFYIYGGCTQTLVSIPCDMKRSQPVYKYISVVLVNQICIYHIYSNARQGFFLNLALK